MSVSVVDPICSCCKSINPCYDREFVNSCIEKYSSDPINKTKTEETICFKCGSVYKHITKEELLAKDCRDLKQALSRYVKIPYIHSEGYAWVKKENWEKYGRTEWEKYHNKKYNDEDTLDPAAEIDL